MIRRAIRVNKLRDAQKTGAAKRRSIEATIVTELQKDFPDLFKQSKRQYKTLKGAANFISKTLQGSTAAGNAELVAKSIKTVSSLERVTKRQAAGLPSLKTITGLQIDKMITQSLDEHVIRDIKLRDYIRKSYEKSNQWQLHRSWRINRDELKLKKIIDEGVRQLYFEPLNTSKFSKNTLRVNYYSAEIKRAMEKYETVNNTYIPMHKRAGWVNVYLSDKVQAEINNFLEWDQINNEDERLKALYHIMKPLTQEESEWRTSLNDLVSP